VRGCKGGRAHGFPAGAERRDHGGRRGRRRRRCRGRRLPPPPIQEAQGYVRHSFLRSVEGGSGCWRVPLPFSSVSAILLWWF
jgi:hypothetical protein